jgi:peptide/nickel transport system substrate-binding protein
MEATMHTSNPSRRRVLGAVAGALAWPGVALALPAPVRGGHLVVGASPEPTTLTSAITSAGPTQYVSGKIFDGLLTYDLQGNPQPQLATRWSSSADGLTTTFTLRPGVRWHDGKPFTARDVAFSLTEVWKVYHSRGRGTFANVVRVDTPDPLTVVLRLSRPAPYLLSALASSESQVIPAHLYAGRAVLGHPANNAPVGTGPFRFVRWNRGSDLVLERNPDYWQPQRPYLDRLTFRFLPDAGAAAAALETGAIQLATTVAPADVARLARNPGLCVQTRPTAFTSTITSFEFNLERPALRDARVRQALAHAIDRAFLVRNVWFGEGVAATSPVPPTQRAFFDAAPAPYPYDPKRAGALLDAAGLKPDGRGVRLRLSCDPYPMGPMVQSAQYLRASLRRIGVQLDVRLQDAGEFVNRVYTRRDFDTVIYGANAGPDPAIGAQRFYLSKNFARGIAFSNGAHYSNPEVDALLEAAQVELDPGKRRDLYLRFQRIVGQDAVTLPLVSSSTPILASRRLHDAVVSADGVLGNFAGAWLAPA